MKSTDVLAALEDAGLQTFTVQDVSRILAVPAPVARGTAWFLHDQGYTDRLKRNLYLVRPVQDWGRPLRMPAQNRFAAAARTANGPHYLAYYSAMEVHRLTRHPLRSAFLAVRKQQRPRSIGDLEIHFVTVTEARFFGFAQTDVLGDSLEVSDLERTVIDGLDRPELCGRIEEVYRGLTRCIRSLDGKRLGSHLDLFGSLVVVKRLGALLEIAGAPARLIQVAADRVRRSKRYMRLDPLRASRADDLRNKRWELIMNIGPDALRAET